MDHEKTNVKYIYNIISEDFNRTRYSVWKSVEEFIKTFSTNSNFLEIGCGNGKNMLLRPNNFIGCDNCENFLKLCKKKNLNVINCCATKLPFCNNSFDASISVAVIHHLSTYERRIKAISEQIRVTCVGGKIFIEVWGFENNNRVVDGKQDSMVPWKYKGKIYNRYYHFFKKEELLNIIKIFKNVIIETICCEKYNWIIILRKIE